MVSARQDVMRRDGLERIKSHISTAAQGNQWKCSDYAGFVGAVAQYVWGDALFYSPLPSWGVLVQTYSCQSYTAAAQYCKTGGKVPGYPTTAMHILQGGYCQGLQGYIKSLKSCKRIYKDWRSFFCERLLDNSSYDSVVSLQREMKHWEHVWQAWPVSWHNQYF